LNEPLLAAQRGFALAAGIILSVLTIRRRSADRHARRHRLQRPTGRTIRLIGERRRRRLAETARDRLRIIEIDRIAGGDAGGLAAAVLRNPEVAARRTGLSVWTGRLTLPAAIGQLSKRTTDRVRRAVGSDTCALAARTVLRLLTIRPLAWRRQTIRPLTIAVRRRWRRRRWRRWRRAGRELLRRWPRKLELRAALRTQLRALAVWTSLLTDCVRAGRRRRAEHHAGKSRGRLQRPARRTVRCIGKWRLQGANS
jgi:hypothetical protein